MGGGLCARPLYALQMKDKYYILWYRLENKDSFLILCSNDTDRVLTNKNGKVLTFSDIQKVNDFASKNGIYLEPEEPILHNLDKIIKWVNIGGAKNIDCNEFNSAWNLFEDISQSVNKTFDSNEKSSKVYEKLFWGCNLPAATPNNRTYVPEWNESEIKILKNILSMGIQIFKESL